MTITPIRNSYAMRTEYAVTTTAGTRTGYPTVEAAEEAGRAMEAGTLEPETEGAQRIVRLVPVGRAAR